MLKLNQICLFFNSYFYKRENRTYVIATHSVHDWEKCDRVIYMDNGKILFDDNFDSYKRSRFSNIC